MTRGRMARSGALILQFAMSPPIWYNKRSRTVVYGLTNDQRHQVLCLVQDWIFEENLTLYRDHLRAQSALIRLQRENRQLLRDAENARREASLSQLALSRYANTHFDMSVSMHAYASALDEIARDHPEIAPFVRNVRHRVSILESDAETELIDLTSDDETD